jgi:hypothetical protein
MRSARFFACVAVASGLAGVGCSSSNTTPTTTDYDDVAQSTAAIVATPGGGGELGSMSASASIAAGALPATLNVSANASGSFGASSAGVTYDFSVSCTDAGGAALSHCGATTNDAQASVTWSGDLTIPDYTATVTRNGTWTLTGVQSGTATFNGTGTFSFASQFQSAFRNEQVSANLAYSASYDAVTYDESAHSVTGGSVHYTINASRAASSTSGSSDGTFTMDAVLTFGPAGSATLTLDGSHKYNVTASGTATII